MSKPELVAVMQTRLGLSKASCYKYINAATAISYDQMSALQHLSPISEVLRRGESDMNPSDTWWYYPPFITDMNISSYLESLFIYLSQMDNAKSKIIMTTYEVPIFYYMYYPDLFAFKLFCWSKTIWMQSTFFQTNLMRIKS